MHNVLNEEEKVLEWTIKEGENPVSKIQVKTGRIPKYQGPREMSWESGATKLQV